MPVATCGFCRQDLSYQDQQAGQSVACPHCRQTLQLPLAPAPAGPVQVRISANLIRWPSVRACCCRPAELTLTTSHTRHEGVRVIRSSSKSWDVPYCSHCVSHMKALEQHNRNAEIQLRRAAGEVERRRNVGAAAGILAGIALMVLGGLIVRAAGGGGAGIAVCALVSLGVGAGVVVGMSGKVEEARQTAENLKADLQAWGANLATPPCCGPGEAVDYKGWHGTVHTFVFKNGLFAAAFRRSNDGKCVG